jgi:hypothetical protein
MIVGFPRRARATPSSKMDVMVGPGALTTGGTRGTAMLIGEPSVERLSRWVNARLDRPALCAYGTRGEMSEPRCEAIVTARVADAAGHPGYCSHAHDALAQQDQVF